MEGVSEVGPSTSRDDGHFSPDTRRFQDIMIEDWVIGLDHDKKALAMLLCFALVTEVDFTETAGAMTADKIVGKSDRTVHQGHSDLITNNGHSLRLFKVDTKEVEFCGEMKN